MKNSWPLFRSKGISALIAFAISIASSSYSFSSSPGDSEYGITLLSQFISSRHMGNSMQETPCADYSETIWDVSEIKHVALRNLPLSLREESRRYIFSTDFDRKLASNIKFLNNVYYEKLKNEPHSERCKKLSAMVNQVLIAGDRSFEAAKEIFRY